jgi:hypothetical protein
MTRSKEEESRLEEEGYRLPKISRKHQTEIFHPSSRDAAAEERGHARASSPTYEDATIIPGSLKMIS